MKIEIDIPQLTELNRKIEQLIGTLNDVAVMQINRDARPVATSEQLAQAGNVTIETNADPGPTKRTRKKREAAPEPEIITYGEAEVQAANEVVKAAAAIVTEQEQPAILTPEDAIESYLKEVAKEEEHGTLVVEINPAPAQEETPALPTLFDMDYFRANVIPAIASANKLPEAKAWIAEHGADALKDLDPKHYAAFHKFACELCGVENL